MLTLYLIRKYTVLNGTQYKYIQALDKEILELQDIEICYQHATHFDCSNKHIQDQTVFLEVAICIRISTTATIPLVSFSTLLR